MRERFIFCQLLHHRGGFWREASLFWTDEDVCRSVGSTASNRRVCLAKRGKANCVVQMNSEQINGSFG